MQLFFNLGGIFILTVGGSLSLYFLLRISLFQFVREQLVTARMRPDIYRPEIGHLYGFAMIGSVTGILIGYLLFGNPIYGLPVVPLISLLSLPIVAYQLEEKRFRAERQAISFLHGLHGLTQGGVALPAAIHCLTAGDKTDFSGTVQRRLKTFAQGQPIREILGETRRQLGLRSVDGCLMALEMAYERGLSIAGVLADTVPSIEAEAEMLKQIRNLRKSVAVQAALASALPWGLLGIFFLVQPETVAGFFAAPITGGIVGALVIWIGLGVLALWRVSEFY